MFAPMRRFYESIREIKSDGKIIRAGNVLTEKSQAGMVYDTNGLFPTICACTHGYAIGYILVQK